jgi:hypothetical protein
LAKFVIDRRWVVGMLYFGLWRVSIVRRNMSFLEYAYQDGNLVTVMTLWKPWVTENALE